MNSLNPNYRVQDATGNDSKEEFKGKRVKPKKEDSYISLLFSFLSCLPGVFYDRAEENNETSGQTEVNLMCNHGQNRGSSC